MKTIEDTVDPTAIEVTVYNKMRDLPRYPMDKDLTENLVMLLVTGEVVGEVPEKDKPFLMKLIEKRLQFSFTFKINDLKLVFFLAVLAKTPGTAIMYLWYLQGWCKTNNIHVLDLDTFIECIFPSGFPSADDLHQVWRDQKVPTSPDNLVDHYLAGKSLQFEDMLTHV